MKKRGEKYIPLYRVQGGKPPRSSKRIISIDENNELDFDLPHRDAFVYIGTVEHMKYFLKKRGHIMQTLDSMLYIRDKEIPVDGVEVVTMYVPEWYMYLLSSLSTVANNPNKRPLEPLLVDKSTPGDAFGICAWWIDILKLVARNYSVKEIKTYNDILVLLMNEAQLNDNECLDYKKISQLIERIDKHKHIPTPIFDRLLIRQPMFGKYLSNEIELI